MSVIECVCSAFYDFRVMLVCMIINNLSRAMRECVLCHMRTTKAQITDQPAHARSLISAFVVRCLDSIISLDSIAEISRL